MTEAKGKKEITSEWQCIVLNHEKNTPWSWQLNQYQKHLEFYPKQVIYMLDSPSLLKGKIEETPLMTLVDSKTNEMLFHLEAQRPLNSKHKFSHFSTKRKISSTEKSIKLNMCSLHWQFMISKHLFTIYVIVQMSITS